jgi:predicted nucleic acid-binding protein
MSRALLDTDILSEVLKKKDPRVLARAERYFAQEGRYTLSCVTVLEVVRGFQRIGSSERLERFLGSLEEAEVLPLDTPAAALAGRIDAELSLRGRIIGLGDVMIAAIALRHGLPLVTGNTDHYLHVRNLGYPLELENWRDAGS